MKNFPHKNTAERRDIVDSNPQPASPPPSPTVAPSRRVAIIELYFRFRTPRDVSDDGARVGRRVWTRDWRPWCCVALGKLDIGVVSVEVAAGDGKLIKLSLIYPSLEGRPTHGISRSSIFVVTLHPRSPLPHLFSLCLTLSTYRTFPASICLAPIPERPACGIWSSWNEALNISIWHQALSCHARAPWYTSLCLVFRPILSFRSVTPRPIRSTPGRRRGGSETRVLPPLVERTEAKGGLGESKGGGGCTRWTNIDRTGTGKVRGRQKRAKSTERRRQDDGGGGDGGGMA